MKIGRDALLDGMLTTDRLQKRIVKLMQQRQRYADFWSLGWINAPETLDPTFPTMQLNLVLLKTLAAV